jgi:ankyrin repeat protein
MLYNGSAGMSGYNEHATDELNSYLRSPRQLRKADFDVIVRHVNDRANPVVLLELRPSFLESALKAGVTDGVLSALIAADLKIAAHRRGMTSLMASTKPLQDDFFCSGRLKPQELQRLANMRVAVGNREYKYIDVPDHDGNTALIHAAISNRPPILAKLVELGANLKVQGGDLQQTAFMILAVGGHGDCMAAFKGKDVGLALKDVSGKNAAALVLEAAKDNINPLVIKALKELGQSFASVVDPVSGENLLMRACDIGDLGVVKLVLESDIDVNAVALHHAVLSPDARDSADEFGLQIAEQIVSKIVSVPNVELSIEDVDGKTPMQCAHECHCRPSVITALQGHSVENTPARRAQAAVRVADGPRGGILGALFGQAGRTRGGNNQ